MKGFHVRAGTSHYYENGEIHRVKSVTIHPAFNENIYDYDVGLVEVIFQTRFIFFFFNNKLPPRVSFFQLADSIKYDSTKRSIKLPRSHTTIEDGVQVLVLGWGASRVRIFTIFPGILFRKFSNEFVQLLGPVSEELLRSTMQKINNENCQEASGGDILTNRMFCALSDGVGPCVGDSGSPLVFENTLFGKFYE